MRRLSLLQSVSLYILTGFLIILTLISLIIFNRVNDSFREEIQERLASDLAKFEGQIEQEARSSLQKAALFSQDDRVLSAYRLIQEEHPSDDPAAASYAHARQKLQEALRGMVKGYESHDLGRFAFHFHLPNSLSLWRAWKPDQRLSDDLAGFRATVNAINQTPHSPIQGIEVGRGGFAIRGIAAITAPDGGHLGSVEYLGDFTAVFEGLTRNSSSEAAVYMHAEQLKIATSLQDAERYPVLDNRFVLTAASGGAQFTEDLTAELLDAREGTFITTANAFLATQTIEDFSGDRDRAPHH